MQLSVNHFAYKKPLCFAWYTGLFMILTDDNVLVDFGDGGLSKGGSGGSMEFDHPVLGNIRAINTRFLFNTHKIDFDFAGLDNSHEVSDIKQAMIDYRNTETLRDADISETGGDH